MFGRPVRRTDSDDWFKTKLTACIRNPARVFPVSWRTHQDHDERFHSCTLLG
jgi:hypothetical protein